MKKLICYTFTCLLLLIVFSSKSHAAIIPEVTIVASRGGSVFEALADRTGSFAQGFRGLAMVLSGFGIIMFTFLAICGKINFKHLGYIFICLFFLSGVGALIVYIADVPPELVFAGDFTRNSDTVDRAVTSEGRSSSL